MKFIKESAKILAISLIPIFIHFIYFACRVTGFARYGWMPYIETLSEVLIYPFAYAVLITIYAKRKKIRVIIGYAILANIVSVSCTLIGYWGWGIATGLLHYPDGLTIAVVNFSYKSAIILEWLYTIILQIIIAVRYFKLKEHK